MAEYKDREHFIPIRKSELVQSLCADKNLSSEECEQFGQFCRLIEATFHFEQHQRLEQLKDAYAPFDPDADTRPLTPLSEEAKEQRLDGLFKEFTSLMERANFKRMSRDDINEAINSGASDWGLNMEIDFNVFDRLEVYSRGDVMGKRSRRRLFKFWQIEEWQVPIYQRLALLLKLKDHKRLPKNINKRAVYFKLFKDIPKVDMEMLLPGARMKMPSLERGKLLTSLVAAVGWVAYKIYLQLALLMTALTTGNPFLFWGPLSLIGGYAYKQYYSYQTTKQTYSLQLTQSLYFQNLDNNGGVITRLLDDAEEQECREAILAYYFLWRKAGATGWTSDALDDYIELELEGRAKVKVDFEVADALAKLERLGIVEKIDDRYRAKPIAAALENLDYTWDNYFKFNQADVSATGAST